MAKDLFIRSSAEEFITFKVQEKDKGIQVRYKNENLWMTQKVTDIYATSIDYDSKLPITINFFKKVQNKCIMQYQNKLVQK